MGFLVKTVLIFLAVMALIAMLGNFRPFARRLRRSGQCTACGQPRIGRGPCPCGKG